MTGSATPAAHVAAAAPYSTEVCAAAVASKATNPASRLHQTQSIASLAPACTGLPDCPPGLPDLIQCCTGIVGQVVNLRRIGNRLLRLAYGPRQAGR